MLNNMTSIRKTPEGTMFRCLLWLCTIFSYICLVGGGAIWSNGPLSQNNQRCGLTNNFCCTSNSAVPILLEKGKVEKQLAQKNRRKYLKDGFQNVFGSDAILPSEYRLIEFLALNIHDCIFNSSVIVPFDSDFHILVRAGPAVWNSVYNRVSLA